MPDTVIDIFDTIGAGWFGEGITAKTVARSLAESEGDVLVRINSPGGDVWEGLAIYNLLNTSKREVKVEIHGLAASSASLIALAGDDLTIHTGAMFMIHNPWVVARGDHKGMSKITDTLKKVRDSLLDVYNQSFENVSRDSLADMMDEETWFTAKDLAEHGLGKVLDFEIAEASLGAKNDDGFMQVAACFMNAPDHWSVLAQRRSSAAPPQPKENPMNKEILAALGLSEDATDEQVLAAVTAQSSPPPLSDFVPRADYEATKVALAKLTAKAEADKAEALDIRVETLIESALKAGKITPGTADFYRKNMKASDEGIADFEAFIGNAAEVVKTETDKRTGVVVGASKTLPDHALQLCTQMGIDPTLFEETYHEMEAEGLIS